MSSAKVFADLESIVALAVARAPFEVQWVMVLTAPVDGLPRPQLILAESGRPADEHPLPWDVRPLGLELRTVRHVPSQPTNLAVQALDAVLPPGADVAGLWRTAAVHISDALGPLPQTLPADLTDVQFFRASRIPPSAFNLHLRTTPLYTGGTGAQEPTTQSTTMTHVLARAPDWPAMRLVVVRGDFGRSARANPP